jgi:putative peptidoglycan lipid II flippase
MSAGRKIARATVAILTFTLLSRILGLGREAAIAYRFGATAATDAFVVAHTIPNIFYQTVGLALATVIVPVCSQFTADGRRDEAWQILSLVINAVIVTMSAAVLIGIAGAPLIVRILGVGLNVETMQLAINLTALMLPSILFKSLAGVLGGILNANQIFKPPALGPALMNLTVIASALAGGIWLGIYSLAFGTVIGAILFAACMVPSLRRIGFRYSFAINFHDPTVKKVVVSMWPVMLASGIVHTYTIIDLWLASGLDVGSIAVLNYARKLMLLPQGIFVMAVTTAIFPTLSKLIAESRVSEMVTILQRGIKAILLLAVPGAVGLIVLRQPIVSLLFERGAFDAEATAMTANALLYFTFGLVGLCLYLPLTRGFYALCDMRTPLFVSLATVAIKLILSLLFIRFLHHAGLALATSVTVLVNMLVLAVLLQHRLPGLFDRSFFSFASAIVIVSALMGIGVNRLDSLLAAHLVPGGWTLAVRVGADLAFGTALFLCIAWLLRLDELRYLVKTFFRLLPLSRAGVPATLKQKA